MRLKGGIFLALYEVEQKLNKIRAFLSKKNLSGILLSTKKNFLWLTDGKNNNVVKNIEAFLVYLLINKDNKYLISWASDKKRIMEEENWMALVLNC